MLGVRAEVHETDAQARHAVDHRRREVDAAVLADRARQPQVVRVEVAVDQVPEADD